MGKYNWNKLKDNLQKGVGEKQQNDYDDPREWKLQRDDQDNGTAVIRLLPGKGGDTPSVVRTFEHSVRVHNKPTNKYRYYIEASPSSIKEDCPISSIYYELGDIGTEEAKKMQKDYFNRSVKFISNILVVMDPANEDNNGKIFYWKYGVKLFEKFQQVLEPTEQQKKVGKQPLELFDPEDGANITLDIKRDGQFLNYDGTTIESPSRAFDTEEQMDEAVLERCYDLTEFISPDHYKPYAELKKKIGWVLEKSPIESYLIAHGSQIITEPYVSKKDGQRTTESAPKSEPEDSATPSMGGSSYTPKSKKEPEIDQSVEDAVDEVVEQAKEEKPKEKPAPKKTVAKGESDDDILDMLNEL